jgi:UDP-glucose 4-epimerase
MEMSTKILSDVHSFRYTIIRPHNCFGEFQSLKDKYRNVIGIMMNCIMRNEPIYIYGDGNQQRAFSYIEDSLDCYITTMNHKADGQIINIGGKVPITINRLTELIGKYMSVDIPSTVQHLPNRFGEVKIAYATWKKSTELLGYKEDIGFEKGIEKMAMWARKIGPQKWIEEKLELWNSKAPKWWN